MQIKKNIIFPISNSILETAVIYEANIRQYSSEGTFEQFTKDIPQLKELGVKIIWLMPIYPISTTKSKGSLGSYYAISDYSKVNKEFGNLEDLKKLIHTAHSNGMYVILDWVANHTGWDHIWLKTNPEYYTKNEHGEIIHPQGTDWTDVADLNFDNHQMRADMLADMKYWIKEVNIDGYRCDMAAMVPHDFWKHTISELRKIKPIFMMAEAWEPELIKNGFEMVYSWDTHHKLNKIARGQENLANLDARMAYLETAYKPNGIVMNFLTNHDENSWNGSVKERMGNAAEAMLALTYCLPGMPLIYSGQEYGMNKKLLFFEKDEIPKTKGKEWKVLKKLGELKNNHIALNGGKNPAAYTRFYLNNNEVFAFAREKEGKKITYIANFSPKEQTFTSIAKGVYTNYIQAKEISILQETMTLQPWEYLILTKN